MIASPQAVLRFEQGGSSLGPTDAFGVWALPASEWCPGHYGGPQATCVR